MSNTRHAKLATAPPPSPEVDQHGIAQAIGQSVAYHVCELLTPVLQRLVDVQERYACLPCTARAKRAERDHEVAVANARAAAEPEPEKPPAVIRQSFTYGCRGPVCWECFDLAKDDIPDMSEYLPAPVD